MGTVNQELLTLLQEKLGVGKTQVYWHIARRRQETKLTRDHSAIALALEAGLDVSKYATEHDLETILQYSPGLAPQIVKILPEKRAVSEAIRGLSPVEDGNNPFIDSKTINAAYRNAELYARFYVFENTLRRVIHTIMERRYGSEWWYEFAPRDIMNATFERRSGEGVPRWRGQWGAEPIFYTEVRDLVSIIENHGDVFANYIGVELNLNQHLELIERVRTSLAFTNPVAQKDREEFVVFLDRWQERLEQAQTQLN
jgi:hypothetical protein